MRWPRSLLLLLAGCAPAILHPREWRETPPDAPCEVEIVRHDPRGDVHLVARYDADGRVVFGTTWLTANGRGFEHITWRDGRVIAIDSFYQEEAVWSDCSFCGENRRRHSRQIDQIELAYRDDRLVRYEHRTRRFRPKGSGWVLDDRAARADELHYSSGRLVEIDLGRAAVRFEHDGARVVRRHLDGHATTYRWRGGQLVEARGALHRQTFRYDDDGRLIGEELETRDGTMTTRWTYDARGRLIERVKAPLSWSPGGQRDAWEYDADGRLRRELSNGAVVSSRRYRGACPQHLGAPNRPDPMARALVTPCVTSPGGWYSTCGG